MKEVDCHAPNSDCEFKMHFTDNFALTIYELVGVIDGDDCNKKNKKKWGYHK